MGDVQVANYEDLTTCEFNLLPSPPSHTPQLDYPRFEVSGSLTGSLKKIKVIKKIWRQAFKDIAVPRRKFPTLTALPRII